MKGAAGAYSGAFPVTPEMIEASAVLGAEICAWKRIDPRGYYKKASPFTGIMQTIPNVADHSRYAQLDGYGADRWDVGNYFVQTNKRLLQHYDALKAGTVQFRFKALMK